MEGIEEIKEDPGDDDTVVDTDKTVDNEAGYSDSDEVRGDRVPRHYRALFGGLAKGELQVEERDTKNKQHDGVGN